MEKSLRGLDLPAEWRAPEWRRPLPLSVLILARDEEANLVDCLHSVRGWVTQVALLLDPRTKDRTRELALELGAEVYEHDFESFGAQRNWALASIPWRASWLLILDADERVSPDLRDAIEYVLTQPNPKAAYAMRFRFIFYGRWIRHCWYGTWIVRLIQLGRARYEGRGVHEHMIVDGELGLIKSDLIHNDFKDMDAWIEKHNRYATAEAEEIVGEGRGRRLEGRLFGGPLQRRRFLKERVWNHLPFRPLWLFLYLYVIRFGFLDGVLGFRFCLMHSVFDAFTSAKVWERQWLRKHKPGNYYRETLSEYLSANPSQRVHYE